MSLLTKEQQLFEKLKKALYRNRGLIDESDESELLSIIDDLQARAPKQYTTEDLREWAKEPWMSDWYFDAYFSGAVDFAEFLGALKAEP